MRLLDVITRLPHGMFLMIPSLEEWPSKVKETPSPNEVSLTLLDTKPVFQCLENKPHCCIYVLVIYLYFLNEWKNTESVINWFKNIPNKHLYKFLMFDIKDIYPSIKENLLWGSIRFAKLYISKTNKDTEVVFHARKSILYYNDETWVKKGESNFDVSTGPYDGAEVCELIGVFMLSLLSKYINKNHTGLYRDDSLAILNNISSPEAEKLKKKF